MLAAKLLRDYEAVDSDGARRRRTIVAGDRAGGAKRLGNTRAVCRKCYVHPAVIDAYLDGSMMKHGGAARPSGRRARSGG